MLVLDIDGTLLDARGQVSALTRATLLRVHQAGMPVVLATGRHHRETEEVTAQLSFPVYVISSNGAVTRSPLGTVLHHNVLNNKLVHELVDSLLPLIDYVCIHFESVLHLPTTIAQQPAQETSFQQTVPGLVADTSPAFCTLPQDHTIQVTLHDRVETNRLNQQHLSLRRFASQVAIERLRFPETSSYLWEINALMTTKGDALRILCSQLQIPLSQVVAIGDNWNDLTMLQAVGYPFLMENACQDLRSRFPFPITRSNHAEGVSHAIFLTWPYLGAPSSLPTA